MARALVNASSGHSIEGEDIKSPITVELIKGRQLQEYQKVIQNQKKSYQKFKKSQKENLDNSRVTSFKQRRSNKKKEK